MTFNCCVAAPSKLQLIHITQTGWGWRKSWRSDQTLYCLELIMNVVQLWDATESNCIYLWLYNDDNNNKAQQPASDGTHRKRQLQLLLQLAHH